MDTASLRSFFGDHAAEALAYLNDRSTIDRIGQPDEIAREVAFPGSDAASYINGIKLYADGAGSQVSSYYVPTFVRYHGPPDRSVYGASPRSVFRKITGI